MFKGILQRPKRVVLEGLVRMVEEDDVGYRRKGRRTRRIRRK